MGNIIWNSKVISSYIPADKNFIEELCNTLNITYLLTNKYIKLYPLLNDKVFLLTAINNSEITTSLVESIEETLVSEGATVISFNQHLDKITLKHLDAHIKLAFSDDNNKPNLTIYLPFSSDEKSIAITKNIIKSLAVSEKNISYKIAGFWDKIRATKYWNYLFNSNTPTILFEIGLSHFNESFLSNFKNGVINSIIKELGATPTNEEIQKVNKLLDKLQEKKDEVKQISQLNQKLEQYKNQLETLKASYLETENELKRIKETSVENVNTNIENNINLDEEAAKPEKIEEPETPLINNDEKKKIKKKNKLNKSKKIYIGPSSKNKNYQYRYLQYPGKIPDNGPVHQFKRPNPGTDSIYIPQNFLLRDYNDLPIVGLPPTLKYPEQPSNYMIQNCNKNENKNFNETIETVKNFDQAINEDSL